MDRGVGRGRRGVEFRKQEGSGERERVVVRIEVMVCVWRIGMILRSLIGAIRGDVGCGMKAKVLRWGRKTDGETRRSEEVDERWSRSEVYQGRVGVCCCGQRRG